MSTNILEDAYNIIYGDREKTYGHPSKNLSTIAVMWKAYLGAMPKDIADLDSKDVAAGAVSLAVVVAGIMGLLIFLPKIINLYF